jgi:hypothetical protein
LNLNGRQWSGYPDQQERSIQLKIVTVQFDLDGPEYYGRLAEVFEHSINKHMPNARVECQIVKKPGLLDEHRRHYSCNIEKLRLWSEVMQRTDEDVVFMDCDILVIRDMQSAFVDTFDIAYTGRDPKTGSPINCGVIFAKCTIAAKDFFKRWHEVSVEMFKHRKFHDRWRRLYPGMTQAAFGYLINEESMSIKLKQFSCREWNACRPEWALIDESTRCIHFTSFLRALCVNEPFDYEKINSEEWSSDCIAAAKRIANLWRKYEKEWQIRKNFVQNR